MTYNNNNTCDIEKFEGALGKEELDVTVLDLKAINNIRNMDALGVYAYIATFSSKAITAEEVAFHFSISTDKALEILNNLVSTGYLENGSE